MQLKMMHFSLKTFKYYSKNDYEIVIIYTYKK